MSRDAANEPVLVPFGLLGCAEADFPRMARGFRSELAPNGLLEGLQVDLAILALTLLRRATAALAALPTDPKRLRAIAQAHAMLRQALREFARLRKPKTATATATKPAEAATRAVTTTPEPAPAPAPVPTVAPRPAASPVRIPRPHVAAFDDLLGPISPIPGFVDLAVGRPSARSG